MRRHSQTLLILGFTAIFIGYLSTWLRGPGVGLSFLGLEMGEWFKFLGLGTRRDLFYLPPITLGLMLAIWTMTWPPDRSKKGFGWRAWAVRALAVLVSLLAFPAIEDINGPVREQYVLRLILIGLVVIVALVSGFWRPQGAWRAIPWLAMTILGILGAVLPSWLFLQVQPFLSEIIGLQVRSGLGLWLNAFGNALVAAVSLLQLRADSDAGVTTNITT